jgi:endonuclease YncB( thermonuclease family)
MPDSLDGSRHGQTDFTFAPCDGFRSRARKIATTLDYPSISPYPSPMKRLIVTLILLILPIQALASDYPARVVGISDGDTLTVLTAEKKQVKIRLHGIDAPETGQDYGQRAKQAASELAFDK